MITRKRQLTRLQKSCHKKVLNLEKCGFHYKVVHTKTMVIHGVEVEVVVLWNHSILRMV